MSALSNYERETIIVFNEKDADARVNTFSKRLIKRAESVFSYLGQKLEVTDRGDGEVEFYIPKTMVTFHAPVKRELTEEQRQRRIQQLKAIREKWKNDKKEKAGAEHVEN